MGHTRTIFRKSNYYYFFLELTAILNDLIETSPQPSTSESVIPTKTSIVPSGSSNIGIILFALTVILIVNHYFIIACTNAFNMIKSNEVMNIPSPAGENTTPPIISNITSNENKIGRFIT